MFLISFPLALLVQAGASVGGPVNDSASWQAPDPIEIESVAGRPVVRHVLLVGVRPGMQDVVHALAEASGARLSGAIPRLDLLRFTLPVGLQEDAFAQELERHAAVRFAERDVLGQGGWIVPGAGAPDDTHYGSQWHLESASDADIDAEAAWSFTTGDPDVVLAILDSGIDFGHPEFTGRLLPGFDFVNEDADPSADHPHGVWVTGLAAANTNNAFQVAGVDQLCTLLPVKVLDANNGGTTFDLAQGLDYCAAEGVEVVSMSLINYPVNGTVQGALENAREAGCILVACAGNGGLGNADVSGPGVSPLTISIGATNSNDNRASFSGTGQALDFVAPGSNVNTVDLSTTNDAFDGFSGCSAATPVAAGIVALMHARDPHLTQECTYQWLQAGADDLVGQPGEDTPGWDPFMGHGRLSAGDSLARQAQCLLPTVFSADADTLVVSAGEVQQLELDAHPGLAGKTYVVLGSLTGTSPGLPLDGFVIPLVPDTYFLLALSRPAPILSPSIGRLDGAGDAAVVFAPPPVFAPALSGATVHHAFVVLNDASNKVVAASNAVSALLLNEHTLFDEDFESSAAGWVFDNTIDGLWHLAPAGECAAPSASAAYHRGPLACDYDTGGIHLGELISPEFQLSANPPFTLRFQSRFEMDPSALDAIVVSVEVTGGGTTVLASTPAFDTSGAFETVQLELPAGLAGELVRVQFRFSHFAGPGAVAGWTVDDVAVTGIE